MTSVLVVDDDKDITANLADILNEFGYQVHIANNAQLAMEAVRSDRFDVALLDFKMPGMNGADLYQEIKKTQPHVVAIMITAHAGSKGVQRAEEVGTWKVLQKPVDIANLTNLIEAAKSLPIMLVVDDDREFCENLWDVFRSREVRVAFAHDESTAVSQIKSNDFDIVLLDLHLGELISADLFSALKEFGQLVRTIVVTARKNESDEMIDSLLSDGAKEAIYKPVDVSKLIQSIETVIR